MQLIINFKNNFFNEILNLFFDFENVKVFYLFEYLNSIQ